MLESHGRYDGATEQTVASRSRVSAMRHDRVGGMDVVRLTLNDGKARRARRVARKRSAKGHRAKLGKDTIEWTGFAAVVALEPEGK